jgi:hypothetical protein
MARMDDASARSWADWVVAQVAERLRETVQASRIYTDPPERDRVTVVGVARTRSGVDGGGGRNPTGNPGLRPRGP